MGVGALPLIRGFYIKYEQLGRMTQYAFAGSQATEVNVYIDLASVLHKIITPSFDMEKSESTYDIAAGVLNMIAHYRGFFRGLGVNARIFFVYSFNNHHSNKMYFPNYNSTHGLNLARNNDNRIDMLMHNISLLTKIIPYMPDSCITVIRQEPCLAMHDIIQIEKSLNPNIIITKDIVTMQVAAMNPNTVIYRPKKSNDNDISFVIMRSNNGLYEFLADDRKCKRANLSCEISSELYSAVLAMIGVKSRDMNSLMSYSAVMNQLNTMISKGKIHNGYNAQIKNIYEEFEQDKINGLINGNIEGRFKAIDLIYQYNAYQNSTDKYNYKGIQNLYDPVGVHQVCEEYFRFCPIDLEKM